MSLLALITTIAVAGVALPIWIIPILAGWSW
jgi:hypothetical protein